jgi:hypothetical protein
MKSRIFPSYFQALFRDWVSVFSSVAGIVLLIILFWSKSPILQKLCSLSATAFLLSAPLRIWADTHRRAERAEAERTNATRPRIVIEEYSAAQDDSEKGEKFLTETLRIVNRGETPAAEITVRPLQMFGRTARPFRVVPSLGPGESTELRILNLRRTLERVAEKTTRVKGHALSVRLPLVLEYRDSQKERWITDHVVLFGMDGISIDIVHADQPPKWTAVQHPRGLC